MINAPIIWRSLTSLLTALAWLYWLCNTGEEITMRFKGVGDLIYEGPWQHLPFAKQKYLQRMLIVAQKPVFLRGIGKLVCSRGAFTVV